MWNFRTKHMGFSCVYILNQMSGWLKHWWMGHAQRADETWLVSAFSSTVVWSCKRVVDRKDLLRSQHVFFFSKYYGCPYPFVARLRRFAIFGAPYEIDWKHSCDVRSGANWHANAWQWDKMSCQLTWMVLMSPGFADLATFFRIFSHGFIQQMFTLWLLYLT